MLPLRSDKIKQFMRNTLFLLFLISFNTSLWADPVLCKSLLAVSDKDTVRSVWVFFKDRPSGSNVDRVSARAMERHRKAGFRLGENSRPVEQRYIREIEKRGGKLRHQFPWENAASFSIHASAFKEIASLPFVKYVRPVNVYTRKNIESTGLAKSQSADGGYGWHLDMVNVKLAHEYLQAKGMGDPGSGVLLAFFDSGFRFDHKAYQHAVNNGLIAAEWDFVDNDNSTSITPFDSIAYDNHGTQTLSLVAGYDPGRFMGIGWGARFAVARTEDYKVESWQEEDNWARAVVWADSIGADIISSSLGYRYGFDDDINAPDFPYDYPFVYDKEGEYDYPYEFMDGKTTIVSRAAAEAFRRGIIVVNSAGNAGNNIAGRLSAPADVSEVIAVGAVDRSRRLANFSSSGPTFDSRPKPDLCAPGAEVMVPCAHYNPRCPANPAASYTTSSGTSFSAPIVSGISALILQANRKRGIEITPEAVKERLYASCSFAAGQTRIDDNRHGKGIPNALFAIMDNDEAFIKITDKDGNGLLGAQIVKAVSNQSAKVSAYTTFSSASDYRTNGSGVAVAKFPSAQLPFSLKVLFRGKEVGSINVDSLPFAQTLAVDIKPAELSEGLKIIKRNNILTGQYFFNSAQSSSNTATVSVVSLNGKILWREELHLRPDGSAEFFWNCKVNGKRAAPGAYVLTLRHDYKMINRKFVIAGY
ncbi:MAG: S8 family serine peptidase [Chitinispirillia bacterium]|nr:S8 family serine peptidase [Chitinispirillia bacterium]